MAETKWTPGPWAVSGIRSEFWEEPVLTLRSEAPGPTQNKVHAMVPYGEHTRAQATARLIAAAPELYAQLEDARITLEEAAKLLVKHYPSVANNLVNQCAIRCADILTKARGE